MNTGDTVAATAALAWWIWPIALFAATFALGIVAVLSGVGGGVRVGLALPAAVMQAALGATILAIAALMWRAKRSEHPEVAAPDRLSLLLGLRGSYHDAANGREIAWQTHRTPAGLALFAGIFLLASIVPVAYLRMLPLLARHARPHALIRSRYCWGSRPACYTRFKEALP